MPYRYRDTKTGRLVPESTWKRSKSKRYKREIIKRKRKKAPKGLYANVLIASGYESRTPGNSYTLTVLIQRKLGETDQHLSNRVEHLAAKGYFDQWADEIADTADLRWASFHNRFQILKVTPGRKRRAAQLVEFEREAP